ncbi:MAG TPA: cytochrome o ubiquinol oxidase subunit IV [Parachlamydiales bacterium]|nr:cytochrome o ubiquinol oxidase subunit IV [Parachlamydiales bacterium]
MSLDKHHFDEPPQSVEYGTARSYALGFFLSALLVLAAYFVTSERLLSGLALGLVVSALGLAQAILQLVLFLNLFREAKPRWNILVFFFMVLVVLILVLGSLWIMNHLNYNMMPESIQ